MDNIMSIDQLEPAGSAEESVKPNSVIQVKRLDTYFLFFTFLFLSSSDFVSLAVKLLIRWGGELGGGGGGGGGVIIYDGMPYGNTCLWSAQFEIRQRPSPQASNYNCLIRT